MSGKISAHFKFIQGLFFLTVFLSIAQAQSGLPPLFDAPWRGFDTGNFGNGFLPVSMATGDLDGDGDTDILVGQGFAGGFENGGTGVSVLKNRGDGTFLAPVYYALPQGQTVAEVALNDFDADGDLDAFATIRGANNTQSKVNVWRNNGDGSLAAHVEFQTGTGPFGIVIADFTGDGHADIVTANSNINAKNVSLLRHNGLTGANAGFLAPVNFDVGLNVKYVASADLNGDAKPDLAVGSFQTQISFLSILLNNGSGGFGAPTTYEAAPGALPNQTSLAVELKDLDNDGDADLIGGAMYNTGGSVDRGAITIRRNNGSGTFGNHETYMYANYASEPTEFAIDDINADGFADIVAVTPSGRSIEGFVALTSNGAGGFNAPVYYEASQWTYAAAIFDADGDGDKDVTTVAQFSAALTVHKNPGNGIFPVPARFPIGQFTDAVESADIDHDGDIDIVTNNEVSIISPDGVVMVQKNNGDGTFQPAVSYLQPKNFADMKLRDINGDGFVDLVLAPDGSDAPYHFGTALNNGNGTFAPTVVTQVFSCGDGSIDAFDLDADGDRDVVLTEEEGCVGGPPPRIFIFRNDGNQNFFAFPPLMPGGFAFGIAGADATGDGRVDLITSLSTGMGVIPNLNNNFTFGAPIISSSPAYKFKLADFNRDGKTDVGMILPQTFFDVDVGTALGNGNGTFAAVQTQNGSNTAESLRISDDLDLADFDRDNKIDLLTFNYASNDVSLFLNSGTGALLPQQRYGIGNTPQFGTVADFNGDRKPDIAGAISLPPSGFQNVIVVLRNLSTRSTKTAFDYDGDGKTDVSIYRPTAGEWWINRSSGGTIAYTFGNNSDRIVPADFTGDDKTDVAVFRESTGEWFILRSENSSYYSFPFGTSGDVPVVGDFDGDGRADAGVFRPSTATWFILRSSGGTLIQSFGQSADVPVVGDYDNDGSSDIAIYRPSNGQWWIQRSASGVIVFQFGNSTDKPVQGDYTGDGKTDVAIWRPATGEWFVLRSENQSYYAAPFGVSTDTPAPGDYDGDGRFDFAVFRPSDTNWYLLRSTSGFTAVPFGLSDDIPVPSAFVP